MTPVGELVSNFVAGSPGGFDEEYSYFVVPNGDQSLQQVANLIFPNRVLVSSVGPQKFSACFVCWKTELDVSVSSIVASCIQATQTANLYGPHMGLHPRFKGPYGPAHMSI